MILFAAALAALAALAQPQAGSSPSCTEANATRASVVEIGANPDAFLDRCVEVTGLFAAIRMYSGRDGVYLVNRFGPDGNPTAANLRHRIGIDNQEMRNLRLRQPIRATVVGRVDSCRRRFDRVVAAGGFPFLAGYCHYESGPTIVVERYRLQGGRYERLMGEAARRRFGNMAMIPDDWPHRAALEGFAADFIAALRARDRARLAELHNVRPDTRQQHDLAVLTMLLDDPASPFAALRDGPPSQSAIFTLERQGMPLREQAAAYLAGILCFCRVRDCSDRWPIASNDADNAPDRPYVCTRVEPHDWQPRGGGLNTPVSRLGFLAEPARTAFRR